MSNGIVSVLFNEPKLLKFKRERQNGWAIQSFSALQRAEIAEIDEADQELLRLRNVSVLFNEPKLLKFICCRGAFTRHRVSVLFNEPKLLKSGQKPNVESSS